MNGTLLRFLTGYQAGWLLGVLLELVAQSISTAFHAGFEDAVCLERSSAQSGQDQT
jgi:hypothetical protein